MCIYNIDAPYRFTRITCLTRQQTCLHLQDMAYTPGLEHGPWWLASTVKVDDFLKRNLVFSPKDSHNTC